MKKIIYIIDPQSVSSLAAYDRNMLGDIKDIDIHFFGNEGYNDEPFNPNVKFYPVFKYGKYTNPLLKGVSYLWSLIIIIFHALDDRPTAAHLQWIRQWYMDWSMILLMKSIGIKIIFTVHNILPRKRKKNTYKRFKKLYELTTKLIVHTAITKRELEDKFNIDPKKIVIMPHGLIELKVTEKELREAEKDLNETFSFDSKIIFAALGVQSPYKGTDMLINAWLATPELRDRKDIVLVIAGKPSGIIFPNNVPNNVIIIPRLLSNPEFKYLIKRTDVMILPYREIDQSGVLLSLIKEEKPYCSTCVGELSKPIDEENIGWKIDNCSEEAIARTLKDIVENPESIVGKKKMKDGWSNLRQKYSWSRSNEILRTTYMDILQEKR